MSPNLTDKERFGRALDLLKCGLARFVHGEFQRCCKERAHMRAQEFMRSRRYHNPNAEISITSPLLEWDVAALVPLMDASWEEIFRPSLGKPGKLIRSRVLEINELRHQWAHQKSISGFEADHVIRAVILVLKAIGAPEATEVESLLESTATSPVPGIALSNPGPAASDAAKDFAGFPSEDPTSLLATMVTCDWTACKVSRPKRDGSSETRWSISYSDPFRFDHPTAGHLCLLIALPLTFIVLLASPFIISFIQNHTDIYSEYPTLPLVFRGIDGPLVPDVGRFFAFALAALCLPLFRPRRWLVSLAIVLLVLFGIFSHRLLPAAPAFHVAVLSIVQVVLFLITLTVMLLFLPMNRRNNVVLEYHFGEVRRFRKQTMELLRRAQEWELRTRLLTKTTEEIGRERYAHLLANADKIKTIYGHDNNPALVPGIRERIAEYVTTQMHEEFNVASRPIADLDRLLEAYGEHDWRCLQAALTLGPLPTSVAQPAVGPETLEDRFRCAETELSAEVRGVPLSMELVGKYERSWAAWRDEQLATLAGRPEPEVRAVRTWYEERIRTVVEGMRRRLLEQRTPDSR